MVYFDEQKILMAFLEEVKELLELLNQKLLDLEASPQDPDVINEIFRLTHSVKSESALVGLNNFSTIAHKMEDIFERVRRGVLVVDSNIVDKLFSGFDRIMEIISSVEEGKGEGDIQIQDVVDPLLEILNEKKTEEVKKEKNKEEIKVSDDSNDDNFGSNLAVKIEKLNSLDGIVFTDIEKNVIEDSVEDGKKLYKIVFHLEDDCDMRYPRAYLVYNNFINMGNVIKTIPDVETETEDEKFHEVTLFILSSEKISSLQECAEVDQVDRINFFEIDLSLIYDGEPISVNETDEDEKILSEDEIREAEKIEMEWAKQLEAQNNEEKSEDKSAKNKDDGKSEEKSGKSSPSRAATGKVMQKQTIRVDIDRLDELINLVGELIINRSRFIQITENVNDKASIGDLKTELEDASNELERISDQMQTKMMQARMVPIGNVFSKFPRMVRDLANSLHKNVNLTILGETTEIDRTVIEAIADPLTHLIRNSIDHGLENPDERERIGKNRQGNVTLKAYQEGANIFIEVSDDGKGINIEAVKSKAVENGLVTAAQANSIPPKELLNLIFEPGFSTKQEISNVSGRGVGMDVVKTEIEKLRGRIDISTKPGEGTIFTIVLPLTTTIIEALLVNVGSNIFAIPISVVEETIKVHKDEIKDFDDYQIYNLRDETLAVMSLSELVGITQVEDGDEIFIVVASFDRRKIGLIVSDMMGEQDIVIKALDDVLKNNEGVAGATVLGDGRIALILDTSTLVKSALREKNQFAEQLDIFGENMDADYDGFYDNINKHGDLLVKGVNNQDDPSRSNETKLTSDMSDTDNDERDKTHTVPDGGDENTEEFLDEIKNAFEDIKE